MIYIVHRGQKKNITQNRESNLQNIEIWEIANFTFWIPKNAVKSSIFQFSHVMILK